MCVIHANASHLTTGHLQPIERFGVCAYFPTCHAYRPGSNLVNLRGMLGLLLCGSGVILEFARAQQLLSLRLYEAAQLGSCGNPSFLQSRQKSPSSHLNI